MGLTLWIVGGALIGGFASNIMKVHSEEKVGSTILIGLFGSVTGGILLTMFGFGSVIGFNLYSLLAAFACSVFFLALTSALRPA